MSLSGRSWGNQPLQISTGVSVFVCMCVCVCVRWRGVGVTTVASEQCYTLQICSVMNTKINKYLNIPFFFPFSFPSLPPFSSPLYCQEGPPLKGQFSTAWHQHRRTSTAVTTVSQFLIKELLEKVLCCFYVHVEGARTLQRALGGRMG